MTENFFIWGLVGAMLLYFFYMVYGWGYMNGREKGFIEAASSKNDTYKLIANILNKHLDKKRENKYTAPLIEIPEGFI